MHQYQFRLYKLPGDRSEAEAEGHARSAAITNCMLSRKKLCCQLQPQKMMFDDRFFTVFAFTTVSKVVDHTLIWTVGRLIGLLCMATHRGAPCGPLLTLPSRMHFILCSVFWPTTMERPAVH